MNRTRTSASFETIDDCMNPRKKTSSPRPALNARKLRSCTGMIQDYGAQARHCSKVDGLVIQQH